jgi:hypothetical protein
MKSIIAEDAPAWDENVPADNANDALVIEVTGTGRAVLPHRLWSLALVESVQAQKQG